MHCVIPLSHAEYNEVVLQRGVMSGFIITILAFDGVGIYAYMSIRKLIEGSMIEVKSLPDACSDAAMIQQVWFNLISNAPKYSGKTENPAVGIGSFFKNATFYFTLPR